MIENSKQEQQKKFSRKLKFYIKPHNSTVSISKLPENNYLLDTQGDIKFDTKKIKRFDIKQHNATQQRKKYFLQKCVIYTSSKLLLNLSDSLIQQKQIYMQSSEFSSKMFSDIKQNVGFYRELNESNILIERMAGRTNETYKVSVQGSNLSPVIYRKFGQSDSNLFLDRETERIIYEHVSEQELGPKIYCYIGDHIRIEEFIESRVLKNKETLLPEVIENVAFTLRKFHYMEEHEMLEQKSLFRSIFVEQGQELLNICTQKMSLPIYDQREQELLKILRQWVTPQQLDFIHGAISPLQSQPLIFSHNDLLANNILIKNSNNKYVFIDYEYSTYNYPIYDIANYFNEFEIDFNIRTESGQFHRNELPENIDELRRYFVECYCLAHHRKYDEYKEALRNAEEKAKVEAEVEKMMGQFWLGVMLSNLMWGWWGIKVCKNPNINFDYLQYCKTKYEKYLQIKNSGLWKVNKKN